MARYCSAQDNVRTRQSPPYRETIRVNVLHGRKSMSWAKSVLPLFTGTSSETFRKVPDRVQIDTTLVRQNRVRNHAFIGRHRLLNRTAVCVAISAEEVIQFLVADPSQDTRIGNLVSVQVKDRQNHTVGCRVQKLIGMPARR